MGYLAASRVTVLMFRKVAFALQGALEECVAEGRVALSSRGAPVHLAAIHVQVIDLGPEREHGAAGGCLERLAQESHHQ